MSRRLTPRGAERRRALLDTAARHFATDGYHPTSVAAIVDDLGVGKGVFYWYFDSKDDCYRQILVDAQRSLRAVQRDAVADEHDPARRIDAGIRASMHWLADNRHLFALLEQARTDERFAPLVRRGEQQMVADTLPHIRAGIAAGLLRREDPELLAVAILGVTDALARAVVLQAGDGPDAGAAADRAAEAAISFCRRGLLVDEADPRSERTPA
ncbi:MAG: TetR/AcrR family transcriptional regulator [Actinomycetota bacterium]|jgi:AcrR family transcriptional regulator|nr:TetR/AcrR family transcriptional regulator [Actinomycetota bacterium]